MNKNWKQLALIAVLSSATTLGAYKILGLDQKSFVLGDSPSAFNSRFTNNTPTGTGVPGEFTYAAEKTTQAVVHIKVKTKQVTRQQGQDPFEMFEDFFGGQGGGGSRRFQQPRREEAQASGSGVIISADGYIVTNNHVVGEASDIEVVLNDKRSYKAKLVGADPNSDIAVIQIKGEKLPFLNFGDSDALRVGEWVLAVGNPFNLESTVTAGIISAKGRGINLLTDAQNPIESFIQTDAVVNMGNSGGALVNLKGELIGINTAIYNPTGQGVYAGYSFAVPVSIVKKVAGDLLKFGAVQRGFLGIKPVEVNSQVADKMDLKVNDGILVQEYTDNSPAKMAGIKINDVIVKVDGTPIRNYSNLTETLGRHKPGDVVRVTVNRDGENKDLNVTLKTIDGTTNTIRGEADNSLSIEELGVKVGNISDAEKSKLKIQGGAKILNLDEDGILFNQGLEEGLVVVKVGDQAIKSAKDFAETMSGRRGRVRLECTNPQQQGSRYFYDFYLR